MPFSPAFARNAMVRVGHGYDARMPSIDKTAEYAASPERLWAVISDLPNWGDWLTVLKEWRTAPPKELTLGGQLEGVISVMSIPMSVTWTVDAVEPLRTITLSGPAVLNSKVTLRADIEASGTGSKASLRIDVENPMLMGALAETLMSAVGRDVEASMANLEQLLAG
jgi:carbon monoxide dehydrogenase subunit G